MGLAKGRATLSNKFARNFCFRLFCGYLEPNAHIVYIHDKLRAKPKRKRGRGLEKGLGAPPQFLFEKSNLKPFILVPI